MKLEKSNEKSSYNTLNITLLRVGYNIHHKDLLSLVLNTIVFPGIGEIMWFGSPE